MGYERIDGTHVVVTGGAGFLGSHLCTRLLARGARVTAVDNLITGRVENLGPLFGQEGFRFVHHDVTDFIHVPGPIDAILHFASPASPIDYLKLPIQTLKVGALGTHKVLGLARATGATLLLASTSEVYGDPQVHPQPETYWGHVNPIGPRGVYDEAKRFAEAMTYAYHRSHDVDVRVVRIFNTYGEFMRMDDGRAVPTFISQALDDEDITLHGDGTQTRSLCHVDDLVDGILALLVSGYTDPVNLGNPEEVPMRQLAETIRDVAGSSSRIVATPRPVDDPEVRQPDLTVAERELGWEPRIGLREGLERTVRWFRDQRHS
ncbi:UDP-glucuronic acid decarboxylase family protein [Nitriliruptor alkaliphilus]|uniref:UDP-glucuronic acid decarboxylase family protein n=1 Tax=Nitriliruptor alkaliphilus TaxID=427918 RepID=UPI000ABEABB3|nr:UDP-glucuronic acid decarboxylase family protein [Nitriliruptor alkaliphilus]